MAQSPQASASAPAPAPAPSPAPAPAQDSAPVDLEERLRLVTHELRLELERVREELRVARDSEESFKKLFQMWRDVALERAREDRY